MTHNKAITQILIDHNWLSQEFPDLKQYLATSFDYATLYRELYYWANNDSPRESIMKFILDKYMVYRSN